MFEYDLWLQIQALGNVGISHLNFNKGLLNNLIGISHLNFNQCLLNNLMFFSFRFTKQFNVLFFYNIFLVMLDTP